MDKEKIFDICTYAYKKGFQDGLQVSITLHPFDDKIEKYLDEGIEIAKKELKLDN